MLTPRQELLLRKVVEAHLAEGQPVGSKALAADAEVFWGPSTVRSELAALEETGLLAHPHTSAGRVPTESGYRHFVDRLLAHRGPEPPPAVDLSLVRREVDEAMRLTTETLSQATDLLAIVSAPPVDTATIRHIEVLTLQPQVVVVVIITSTGGVSKRIFTFERPVDPGLVSWAASFLEERLVGMGLGARMLNQRLLDPELGTTERQFLRQISPAFTQLADAADDSLYFEGTARLLGGYHVQDASELNALVQMLERRVTMLQILRRALDGSGVYVRIGSENEAPALRHMSLVAAAYGLPQRNLGAVSIIGPVRMDYELAISSVRRAAAELSRFVSEVYEESWS